MTHLTPEQLVDLADGVNEPAAAAHLAVCARCREELAGFTGILDEARGVDVPEPSPLFWTHFSDRVRAAVASEAPARAWSIWSWRGALAAAAVLAVAVSIVPIVRNTPGLGRGTPAVQAPGRDAVATAPAPGFPGVDAAVEPSLDDLLASGRDDASFQLVADLAAEINWDEAAVAELGTRRGSIRRLVPDLTDEERLELQRLLEDELRRTGA